LSNPICLLSSYPTSLFQSYLYSIFISSLSSPGLLLSDPPLSSLL
jgi:hypothetical protein